MFGRRRSPKIFCVQKASYSSISVREIIGFHSSMILPTLMVFNQAQNDKTCYKPLRIQQIHSKQLYVIHDHMHDMHVQ